MTKVKKTNWTEAGFCIQLDLQKISMNPQAFFQNLIESMFLGEVVDDQWHLPEDTSYDENRKAIEDDAIEPQAPVSA
jgi:hypothetical protein